MAEHLAQAPEYASCGRLAVYSALADELSLADVMERARADGKQLLLPRTALAGRLELARFDRGAALVPGRFGVLEAGAGALAEPLSEDLLLLVPGLAFDSRGVRLGRGAGIWDRALACRRGAKVFGVGYELQIVERLPSERHDQRMDALLTESGIRRIRG